METLENINIRIKDVEKHISSYDEKRQNGKILDVFEVIAYTSYLMALTMLHEAKDRLLANQN